MAPAVRRPAQWLAVRCRRRVRDQLPHAAGRDAAGVRRAQTGRRTEAGRARLHRHQPGRGDVHLGRGRTALRLRRRLSRAAGRPARRRRGRGRNCGRLRQHRLLGNAAAGFRRRVAALRRLPFRQPARRAGGQTGRRGQGAAMPGLRRRHRHPRQGGAKRRLSVLPQRARRCRQEPAHPAKSRGGNAHRAADPARQRRQIRRPRLDRDRLPAARHPRRGHRLSLAGIPAAPS
jgi:hypothetical protein